MKLANWISSASASPLARCQHFALTSHLRADRSCVCVCLCKPNKKAPFSYRLKRLCTQTNIPSEVLPRSLARSLACLYPISRFWLTRSSACKTSWLWLVVQNLNFFSMRSHCNQVVVESQCEFVSSRGCQLTCETRSRRRRRRSFCRVSSSSSSYR